MRTKNDPSRYLKRSEVKASNRVVAPKKLASKLRVSFAEAHISSGWYVDFTCSEKRPKDNKKR